MSRSSFSPSADRTPLAAKGYRKGKEAEDPPLRDVPAGGLNTSVLDLSRFVRMVFAGGKAGDRRIMKPETLAEMLRPQNAEVPLDLDFRVGLGWMLGGLGDIDIRNGGPVAHHAGATLLFHGQMIVLPERKLGVVVLANSDTSGRAVGKVATEALKLALEAKTGDRQPEREKSEGGEGSLSPEALQRYEGWYATPVGAVNVRKTSGGLRADVMNRTLRLIPRADGSLGLQYRLLGLFPIRIEELDGVGISRADVAGREILAARMHGREFADRRANAAGACSRVVARANGGVRDRQSGRRCRPAGKGTSPRGGRVPVRRLLHPASLPRHDELRGRTDIRRRSGDPGIRARDGRDGPGGHRKRGEHAFLFRVSAEEKGEVAGAK